MIVSQMRPQYKIDKSRIEWRHDPVYLSFEKRLYETYLTFDEALELSTFRDIVPSDLLPSFKEAWTKQIRRWNKHEKRFISPDIDNKTIGFAALVFIASELPYESIPDLSMFNTFQLNKFNFVRLYYDSSKQDLNLPGVIPVADQGPMFPAAFLRWLNEELDSASWWITYFIYERMNGLPCVVSTIE